MGSDKIVTYEHPNPERRSYFTGEYISPPRGEVFRNPVTRDFEKRLQTLGAIGSQIVREALEISGVREIRIRPEEVLVTKEVSASWPSIENEIIRILRRALRKKRIQIVNGSKA